jgi:hypothetical protein
VLKARQNDFFRLFEGWLQRFFRDAPRFIQAFANLSSSLQPSSVSAALSRGSREGLCQSLIPALKELRQAYLPGLKGLSGEGYETLRKVFDERPALRHAWTNDEAELVRAAGRDADDQWFSERSAEASFSETAVFGFPHKLEVVRRLGWKYKAHCGRFASWSSESISPGIRQPSSPSPVSRASTQPSTRERSAGEEHATHLIAPYGLNQNQREPQAPKRWTVHL